MTADTLRIPGEWHIPYQYSIGTTAAEFFDALKERRILGVRCGSCERVAVPPKAFCEYCFIPLHDLVEVGHEGVVEAVTVVTAPFAGSPPVPYCVAYVRLDGATSAIANYLRGLEFGDPGSLPSEAQIGQRVSVSFTDEPAGRITDFWFEPDGTA